MFCVPVGCYISNILISFFSVDQINEPIHSQSFFILSYLYTTMYAGKKSDLFHIIQFIEI